MPLGIGAIICTIVLPNLPQTQGSMFDIESHFISLRTSSIIYRVTLIVSLLYFIIIESCIQGIYYRPRVSSGIIILVFAY